MWHYLAALEALFGRRGSLLIFISMKAENINVTKVLKISRTSCESCAIQSSKYGEVSAVWPLVSGQTLNTESVEDTSRRSKVPVCGIV